MSNKKNINVKKPEKKAESTKKKLPLGIIIAAVAVVVAAAAAVTIYFVLNKNDNNIDKPVVDPVVTVDSGDSKYEMAEYKGTKLPVEFVEILNQAELDSYEACEEYGVALKLGERNISMQEFVMYYYDVYYFQTESVTYSIEQTGANRTGFDLTTLPRDQKHPRNDYTWAEYFTLEVIENLKLNYMMFDEAVANGIELSNSEISELESTFDFLEKSVEANETTLDEDLAKTYCEGVTSAMYKAREIVVALATKYDSVKQNEIKNGYGDEVIEAEFNQSNGKYSVRKLRIYPIEGDYVEEETATIKTEEQLIEYARSNHPREGYEAEYMTDCGYITKERVASVYGDEVAEWAFAQNRKVGEVAVVQGMLFRYVVYIGSDTFYTTSCDIMFTGTPYDETMTAEQRQNTYKQEEEKYLKWKNEDGTKQGFYDYSTNLNGIGEETVRLDTYNFEFDKWIFDPERKSGDSAVIDTVEGCGAIYYIEKNEGDFDWIENLGNEMATEDLKAYQQEVIGEKYITERDKSVLNKAYNASDKSIANHQKKLAESMQ